MPNSNNCFISQRVELEADAAPAERGSVSAPYLAVFHSFPFTTV